MLILAEQGSLIQHKILWAGLVLVLSVAAFALIVFAGGNAALASGPEDLDQEQWTSNGAHGFDISQAHFHRIFDQSGTAGKSGLLTNVEFEATILTNNVFFYLVDGGRWGGGLSPVLYVNLAIGSGVYNIDVSSAGLQLEPGDVYSIGFQSFYVGYEGDDGTATSNGSVSAAINTNAYTRGTLYYRYSGTGWLGLAWDTTMTSNSELTWTPRHLQPARLRLRFPMVLDGITRM
jgi:hypothetical protein